MLVLIHLEEADGEPCWWAESPDLPGWTAAASSLPGLRSVVSELGVPFTERLDAPAVDGVRMLGPVVLTSP